MKRSLVIETNANSCYFRTSVDGDGRKALIQVTERCNLHCAHCFVSSGNWGDHMPLHCIIDVVIPRLVAARVERITLTGGEPFVHPDIMAICHAVTSAGIPLGICTNATQTSEAQIATLQALGNVHVNVSFDGFRADSHGKFRGDRSSFAITKATTRRLAEAGLLQGLLSTPNMLTEVDEFTDLCEFAVECGAEYVLMNPLSNFGRGVKSKGKLAADEQKMRDIRELTKSFTARGVDMTYIRFPNDALPLGGCDAGKLIYVFADGQVAVCPYLVFAARAPESRYRDSEFLVGNILDQDIDAALDAYDFHRRFTVGTNATCDGCGMNSTCGKGCPAAIVTAGGVIGDVDTEQCPVAMTSPILQIGRRPS